MIRSLKLVLLTIAKRQMDNVANTIDVLLAIMNFENLCVIVLTLKTF
jgi:hypothetical protein